MKRTMFRKSHTQNTSLTNSNLTSSKDQGKSATNDVKSEDKKKTSYKIKANNIPINDWIRSLESHDYPFGDNK